MARFDHPIVAEVASLDLPYPEQVVINHGSALVVRGLRDEHQDGDIDMLTSQRNIDYLVGELGWRAYEQNDRTAYRDSAGRFDVHLWDGTSGRRLLVADEIVRSDQDEATSIWIASLELVRETKLDTGRPQDIADIALIDACATT